MRRAAGGTPAGGLGGRARARAPTARGRTQQHASPTKATPAPARQRCRPEHATAGDAGANTGHQTQPPRRGHLATRARNGWGRGGEHGTPDGSAHRHARPRPAERSGEGEDEAGRARKGWGHGGEHAAPDGSAHRGARWQRRAGVGWGHGGEHAAPDGSAHRGGYAGGNSGGVKGVAFVGLAC